METHPNGPFRPLGHANPHYIAIPRIFNHGGDWTMSDAFDQGWNVAKMGRLYRGGNFGDMGYMGDYFSPDLNVAALFGMGGGYPQYREPQDVWQVDDPGIDEQAIENVSREFYSKFPRPRKPNALDDMFNIEEMMGQILGFDGEYPMNTDLDDHWANPWSQEDGQTELSDEDIEWLKTGNAAMFLEPQQQSGYVPSFMLSGIFDDKDKATQQFDVGNLPLIEHQGGQTARDIAVDRLFDTGRFASRDWAEDLLRRYISQTQGVGKNLGGTNKFRRQAVEDAFKEAGIGWLGYMDKDPHNQVSMKRMRGKDLRPDYFNPDHEGNEILWANTLRGRQERGLDELDWNWDDHVELCPGCGTPTHADSGETYCQECFDKGVVCGDCGEEFCECDEF